MTSILCVAGAVLFGLAIIFAGLYDYKKLVPAEPLYREHLKNRAARRRAAVSRAAEPEIKGDPAVAKKFAPLVKRAIDHFPDLEVWGQFIQNGTGYAIFFTDGEKKSCWQAMSTIQIDGKKETIDVFNSEDPEKQASIAFMAVAKSFGIESLGPDAA